MPWPRLARLDFTPRYYVFGKLNSDTVPCPVWVRSGHSFAYTLFERLALLFVLQVSPLDTI